MKRKRNPVKPEKSAEYDLHGLSVSEATDRLLRIMDRHQGRSGTEIQIVHGIGKGLIAAEVERIAQSDPRIGSFSQGFLNRGVTTLVLNGKTLKRADLPATNQWDHILPPPVRHRKR